MCRRGEAGAPGHVDIALLGLDASEEEVRRHRSRPVEGLRALVHGHFVVDEVERLANRWNIGTGATFAGRTGSRCFTSTRGAFAHGRSKSTRSPDAYFNLRLVVCAIPRRARLPGIGGPVHLPAWYIPAAPAVEGDR